MEAHGRRSSSRTASASGPRQARSAELATLQLRLRRLEGQVQGVAEMVARDRDTLEVLQQFSAILAAGREAALSYARAQLGDELRALVAEERSVDDVVARLESLLGRASRLP